MPSQTSSTPVVDTAQRSFWEEPGLVLGPLMEAGARAARTTSPLGTMLLGAEVVQAGLGDPRLGAPGSELLERTGWRPGPFVDWFGAITVHIDPPDHTRLRSLVSRAFTPRAVERFRAAAAEIAHELCDEVVEGVDFDFTTRWARALPLRVICRRLGITTVDAERLGRWSSTLGQAMSASAAAVQPAADRATTEFAAYVEEVIAERRAHPGDDLLSALIEAEDGGDRLSTGELTTLTMQLIFAGHETTQTLLSTGLWRLVHAPGQAELLRRDPSLVPGAVEEMLRLDPPAVVVARVPHEPVELGGATLEPGDYVTLSLYSANHDPTRYERPGELDVTRAVDRQFAFGFGAHFCVGNHLARVEAATAFEVLLERFADIREAGTSRWVADTLRGRRDVTIRATPA